MRNICKITFLLLFVFNSAFSQEIEWQNTIGGIYGDKLKCTMRNNDGGVILAGYSNSPVSGDKTEVNIGGDDFWIVKIDSMGNIQWQRTLGGSGRDRLTSIQKVANGGLVLGGYSDSDSSGNKSEASNGSYDYWIVKIDSNGIIQWQNTIGGSSYDALYSLQSTNDGGYILGGYSNSPASGDKSEGTSGFVDIWIVKVDSVGVVEWEKTIGGNGSDGLFCLNQTKDNGFILASASSSGISGEKNDSCRGLDDYWIIKFNSDGIIEWQKTIGGSDSDYPYAIQQTQDDGYIVGGKSLSPLSGEKTEDNKGDFDMWVVKIDSIGNTQWQNTIGGNNYDILNSIVQTPNNEFLIGGMSGSGIGGDKTENVMGQFDYWVLKLDSLGNILWQNTIGGSDSDELNSVELTSKEGSYYLGGVSYSNSSFDKTENGVGGQNGDFWVIKLTESYNLIKGNLFADFNSNGIQDNGEPPLPARKITELNSGRFAFSEQNGNYSVLVVDSGSFTVSPQSINWYTPSPISHAVAFTGIQLTDSLNDFAFQPQGTFEDVCITITPMGNFRSGFTAYYQIDYGNYGNTTVAPTVYFYPFSNVTYQSATLTPSSVTLDSIVWNLPALSPFQTGSIIVTVNVNLGLPIGTLINSSAHIEPYLTDDNPSCNNSNWEVYTTGSFDPNDILVNRSDFTTTELSASPWLEYIIRFQNTGNDTAFAVKILNPIDTFKLNLSTIEFVNASHPVNLNWINYQRNMEFKFENILLVDSNTNEPLSHGFVRYRIQPKTNLSAGDSITNFAAIYFDFNEPVITNTAKTIIVLPTGLASASPARGKLHVFPNPTENTLNISGIHLENGKAQLRLTDIYGKLIFEKTITSITTTLETNNFSSGIYLIQSGELRAAFVKQ
jgi:hypothetical protein